MVAPAARPSVGIQRSISLHGPVGGYASNPIPHFPAVITGFTCRSISNTLVKQPPSRGVRPHSISWNTVHRHHRRGSTGSRRVTLRGSTPSHILAHRKIPTSRQRISPVSRTRVSGVGTSERPVEQSPEFPWTAVWASIYHPPRYRIAACGTLSDTATTGYRPQKLVQ